MKSLLAAIAATLGGLSIVGVNELAYRIFANTSYIGTWMRGSDLNASRYQVYFKPWNFYLQLAYDWYGYFIFIPFGVVALLLIKFVFDATILKKSAKNDGALNLSHYVSLFVISALALTVLSVPSWKFDRVFVSYAPLLAAMMGYSIALLPSLVATERRSLNYMLNVPLGAIVLFFGFSAFQLQATELDKFKSGGYQKYSALYDFVRALPGSSIGFLGPKAYFGRSRVLEAHTNKVVQYVVPENFAQTEIETSIGKLMSRSIGYLNVSQLIDPETLKQVYAKLNSPYCYKLYEYLGFSDIWQCLPYKHDNQIVTQLAQTPRRSRVALMNSDSVSINESIIVNEFLIPFTLTPERHMHSLTSIMNTKGISLALLEQSPEELPADQLSSLTHVATDSFIGKNGKTHTMHLYRVTKPS